ncbi:rap guanine nucleotide exchange factor 1-like [Dysidea avara]|uniref:rap guanine nucleotide exchange factor 1-like n=1 Tax=Dysidea avara TaxID=196820 RepID=UPI0033261D36
MYYLAATIRISLLQDDGGYSLRGGPVDAVIAYGCITTEYCSGYGGNKNSIISGSNETLDDDEDNLLEVEDVAAYLRFNKEDDGGYSLRGGPVDALIAYAASPLNIADKHYTEAFLLIYPTFVTHEELINKLVYRLQYFYKENRQTMWTSCTSLLVRVLKNIKMGLSQEIDVKVIGLVYMMLSTKQLKFAQLLRDALITKLKQLIPDHTAMFTALPKMLTDGAKHMCLTTRLYGGFAKQMTLLDAGYFYKLDIYEMLCWAAEADEEKSPGLTKFTEHFNNVSQWTKTLILDRSLDKKGRERVMLYFISIMKSLRHINNFNSYLAILSAIESASISRLEWSEKVIKNLEEPRALIDNKGSFKAYRDAFGTATPPCIPYIGLYLQDLTFINMVGDKLEDDKSCINFNKRWKQYNTVDKIRLAQTKQYTIDPDHEILIFFRDFENHLPDSDLYKISLEIKPRGTATVTS